MIFQILNSSFESLSALLGGMPVDQIRMVFAFLITIPFGLFFGLLKGATLRHIVSIVLGLFLQYLVYSEQILLVILQTVVVYALVSIFKRKAAVIVFVESLVYLSGYHIYRQYTSYGTWNLDVSTMLMLSLCKWTSFAWNYADGGKDEAKLNKDQKLRSLKKLPSFLEYFSYIHFFGSACCGPNFDFYDFDLFIRRVDVFEKIPLTLPNALTWMVKGFAFSLTTVVILPMFPLHHVVSEEYLTSSLLWKFLFFNICITLMRFKYYAGWCLSQAGLAATGATYNGVDEKGENKWDRIVSCIPSSELSYDIRYKVECWNSSVQVWLKKYLYLRIYPEEQLRSSVKKQTIAQYLTNIISAFWHGFYPGYYTTFFQWTLLMTAGKYMHNASTNKAYVFDKIRKLITPPVFNVCRVLLCIIPLNCFGIGFQLLSLDLGHIYYKSHGYSVLVLLLSVIAFFAVTGWGQKKAKKPEEAVKPEDKKVQEKSKTS